MKGHLRKRGHLVKSWKRRFFVLDEDGDKLTYYVEEGGEMKGEISLARATVIDGSLSTQTRGFMFSVVENSVDLAPPASAKPSKKMNTVEYVLEASSEVEKAAWMSAIKARIIESRLKEVNIVENADPRDVQARLGELGGDLTEGGFSSISISSALSVNSSNSGVDGDDPVNNDSSRQNDSSRVDVSVAVNGQKISPSRLSSNNSRSSRLSAVQRAGGSLGSQSNSDTSTSTLASPSEVGVTSNSVSNESGRISNHLKSHSSGISSFSPIMSINRDEETKMAMSSVTDAFPSAPSVVRIPIPNRSSGLMKGKPNELNNVEASSSTSRTGGLNRVFPKWMSGNVGASSSTPLLDGSGRPSSSTSKVAEPTSFSTATVPINSIHTYSSPCEARDCIRIFHGTWNMAEQPPPSNLKEWIIDNCDIYAFSLQECMYTDEFLNKTHAILGNGFKGLKHRIGATMKGLGFHGHIALVVFVRKWLIETGIINIGGALRADVALGRNLFVTRAGNKGAVAISLPLTLPDCFGNLSVSSALTFISCHLASDKGGKSRFAKRNKHSRLIVERLGLDISRGVLKRGLVKRRNEQVLIEALRRHFQEQQASSAPSSPVGGAVKGGLSTSGRGGRSTVESIRDFASAFKIPHFKVSSSAPSSAEPSVETPSDALESLSAVTLQALSPNTLPGEQDPVAAAVDAAVDAELLGIASADGESASSLQPLLSIAEVKDSAGASSHGDFVGVSNSSAPRSLGLSEDTENSSIAPLQVLASVEPLSASLEADLAPVSPSRSGSIERSASPFLGDGSLAASEAVLLLDPHALAGDPRATNESTGVEEVGTAFTPLLRSEGSIPLVLNPRSSVRLEQIPGTVLPPSVERSRDAASSLHFAVPSSSSTGSSGGLHVEALGPVDVVKPFHAKLRRQLSANQNQVPSSASHSSSSPATAPAGVTSVQDEGDLFSDDSEDIRCSDSAESDSQRPPLEASPARSRSVSSHSRSQSATLSRSHSKGAIITGEAPAPLVERVSVLPEGVAPALAYVFLSGDLNYRVSLGFDDALRLVSRCGSADAQLRRGPRRFPSSSRTKQWTHPSAAAWAPLVQFDELFNEMHGTRAAEDSPESDSEDADTSRLPPAAVTTQSVPRGRGLHSGSVVPLAAVAEAEAAGIDAPGLLEGFVEPAIAFPPTFRRRKTPTGVSLLRREPINFSPFSDHGDYNSNQSLEDLVEELEEDKEEDGNSLTVASILSSSLPTDLRWTESSIRDAFTVDSGGSTSTPILGPVSAASPLLNAVPAATSAPLSTSTSPALLPTPLGGINTNSNGSSLSSAVSGESEAALAHLNRKKIRIPSYTDRCLVRSPLLAGVELSTASFLSRRQLQAKQLQLAATPELRARLHSSSFVPLPLLRCVHYDACDTVTVSDHLPVSAVFELPLIVSVRQIVSNPSNPTEELATTPKDAFLTSASKEAPLSGQLLHGVDVVGAGNMLGVRPSCPDEVPGALLVPPLAFRSRSVLSAPLLGATCSSLIPSPLDVLQHRENVSALLESSMEGMGSKRLSRHLSSVDAPLDLNSEKKSGKKSEKKSEKKSGLEPQAEHNFEEEYVSSEASDDFAGDDTRMPVSLRFAVTLEQAAPVPMPRTMPHTSFSRFVSAAGASTPEAHSLRLATSASGARLEDLSEVVRAAMVRGGSARTDIPLGPIVPGAFLACDAAAEVGVGLTSASRATTDPASASAGELLRSVPIDLIPMHLRSQFEAARAVSSQ